MMTTKQQQQQQLQEPALGHLNSDAFLYSFENEYPANDVCVACPQESNHQNQHEHPLVQKDFMPTFYNPFETKHRRRTSRAQFKILETSFLENTKPNATMRRWLAQKLDMTPRSVQVWFQNRRAKAKSQLHRHLSPPSPSSSPSSSSSTLTTHHFESSTHTNEGSNQQTMWPAFVSPPIKEDYCQQPSPLDGMSQIQWQPQQQQQMTYDPLSMLMDSPDLISWYSSSPVSSPLPSLLPPTNNQQQQQQVESNSLQVYSPQSPPTPYRRSSFPINFDMHIDSLEKDSLRRLSEPIFDLQSPSTTSFPYVMIDLQQQQQHQQQQQQQLYQHYSYSTFNDYPL